MIYGVRGAVCLFQASNLASRELLSASALVRIPMAINDARIDAVCGIGLNLTTGIFLGEPFPKGFGFSQTSIAGAYATPIVSIFVSYTDFPR